ncbi:MAG: glycine cleavage system aminomethyltransferase GcvT [Thermoproteales archaeon]|nr:glycine cleavage system aminomethyltransferase GcvT [Thermoproteales archaeon]
MRKTPFLDFHKEINASIGEFSGWTMPIDYGDMLQEALITRKSVTFFDISHLSRIVVSGKDALNFLQRLVARDIKKLSVGKISGPTAFLNQNAGFKDDVMVYRLTDLVFLIVGNAINHDKIVDWLNYNSSNYNVDIKDITFDTAMLALQGPQSTEKIKKKIGEKIKNLSPLNFLTNIKTKYGEIKLISYSGWTGEAGYEIICDIDVGEKILRDLYQEKILPAGLGARDILRIEMGYNLYGNEINENINPIEAKYWIFSWKKEEDYIGKKALFNILKNGVEKVKYGLLVKKGSPLPRKGMKIYIEDKEIGFITSGTFSPLLKTPIALGYINSKHSILGLKVKIFKGNKEIDAKLVEPPFIKRL